jgi:uncharacterized membrane protein SpoIIM required for sporulation
MLFVFVVAIFGMRSRLRFADRLSNAYKDKKKLEYWASHNQKKRRLLLLIALVSILGIVVLWLLTITGVIIPSIVTLMIFGTLVVIVIMTGFLLLKDVEKLVK